MIEIPLTRGKTTIVDSFNSHLTNRKWHLSKRKYNCYAVNDLYERGTGKRTTVFLHHCVVGHPLGRLEVDHINGDSLDNRRENLRIVTRRENNLNRKSHRNKTGSSRYPGVSWSKVRKGWLAQISVNGHRKYLGVFETEEEALKIYQEAAKL